MYFIAALQGTAAGLIPIGEVLKVSAPTPIGLVPTRIATYLNDEGHESPVPRGLWFDMRGEAPDLEAAVNASLAGANFLGAYVAFCANASVGDVAVELAYDATPGLKERAYFQQFVRGPFGLPRPARSLEIPATLALMKAVGNHPDGERLHRAVEHYRLALEHWTPGKETFVLSDMYPAFDALAPVCLAREVKNRGISDKQLAQEWGISADLGPEEFQNALLAQARKRLLFDGDAKTYQDVRKARTGYQHSFLSFPDVREIAERSIVAAGAYLRKAVIRLSDLQEPHSNALLGPKFTQPLAQWSVISYLKGTLLAETDASAAGDQEYPIVKWSTKVSKLARLPDGKYEIKISQTITPRLAEGVQFRADRFEMWGPRME